MGFPNWALGVIFSLVGCSMSNLGINMQKLSHMKIDEEVAADKTKLRRSAVTHPIWLTGMAIAILGSFIDLAAFAFADISLLAPLGAMTLVINMFIAPCISKEKLTKRDIASTVVILAGTVLSVFFGSKSSKDYDLDELIELFTRSTFVIYIIIYGAYLVASIILVWRLNRRVRTGTAWRYDRQIASIAYPVLAGTCGAHSCLFAKSCAEILKQFFSKDASALTKPVPYFLAFFLFFFLALQVRFLNDGLKVADALLVVPVYQVCWVVMNIVVGMIYFQEYQNMSSLSLSLFSVGVLITLVGVYLLATRMPSAPAHAAEATVTSPEPVEQKTPVSRDRSSVDWLNTIDDALCDQQENGGDSSQDYNHEFHRHVDSDMDGSAPMANNITLHVAFPAQLSLASVATEFMNATTNMIASTIRPGKGDKTSMMLDELQSSQPSDSCYTIPTLSYEMLDTPHTSIATTRTDEVALYVHPKMGLTN